MRIKLHDGNPAGLLASFIAVKASEPDVVRQVREPMTVPEHG